MSGFCNFLWSQSSVNFYRFPYEAGIKAYYKISVEAIIPFRFNRFRLNIGTAKQYYYFFDSFFDFRIHLYQKMWYAYVGSGIGVNYWTSISKKHLGLGISTINEIGIDRYFFKQFCVVLSLQMTYDFIMKEFNNIPTFSVRYRFLRKNL